MSPLEEPYVKDGMVSIGDFPFPIVLPEPIISTINRRLCHGSSQEFYDPDA